MISFLLIVRNIMAVIVYGSLTVRFVLLIIKIAVESRDLKAYKLMHGQNDFLCIEAEIAEHIDTKISRYRRNKESIIVLTYEVNGQSYRKEITLYNSSGFHKGGKVGLIYDPIDPSRAALNDEEQYRDIKAMIHFDIAQLINTVIFFALCAITLGIKISFEI